MVSKFFKKSLETENVQIAVL